MKFPNKPIKGEKYTSTTGHEFTWNGYAWDILSNSNSSNSGSATTSTSTEEIKEFLNPDGKTSIFQLSSTPLFGSLKVFLNGILQKEDTNHDYVLENNTITFAYVPDDISDIQCIYLKQVYVRITNEIPIGDINGSNNRYRLGNVPIPNSEQIFLNGMLQRKELDYTIEEDIVIFNESPLDNSVIICNYKI